MSRAFVDTSVLAYASDDRYRAKKRKARALLADLSGQDGGVTISTQVLQEYYVVATSKLGIEPTVAKAALHNFCRYEVVTVTPELIQSAVDIQIVNRLTFWDALIVAAAESARCDMLYTEDLTAGQIVRGVRIENPFA